MSLPPASPRNKLHTRTIVVEGFQREDGFFDIEARLVDTKTVPVSRARSADVPPGSPVHEMEVRLTVDAGKVVRDIAVSTSAAPHAACFTVEPAFRQLIGASLVSGWRQAVNQAVGNTSGCTHLKELLGPVATIAFQTMSGGQRELRRLQETGALTARPFFLDKCKGWDVRGEAVKELLPEFYVAPHPGAD